MHLVPRSGHVYRRTDDSKALVGEEGFEADTCDLDVIRAMECGDLATPEQRAAEAEADLAAASAGPVEDPAAQSAKKR